MLAVIVNPRSRTVRKDPGLPGRLARTCGSQAIVRTPWSLLELEDTMRQLARERVEVLAIVGGDGTIHVTLTAAVRAWAGEALPRVALLRGGTMNTVARSIGLRHGSPESILARLLEGHEAGRKVVSRVLLQVGERYGFLFGMGVFHGFLAEYYRQGEPTPRAAMVTLLRALGSAVRRGQTIQRMAAPITASLDVPGLAPWPLQDYLGIAAGTIDEIGLGFRPFPRFSDRPNAFHLVALDAPAARYVWELPRVRLGKPLPASVAKQAVTGLVTIRTPQSGLGYMMDGDLYINEGTELTLEAGPKIQLITIP